MSTLKQIEQEKYKLYSIYKTIWELLTDRNYTTNQWGNLPTYENFINHFKHPNGIELYPKKSSLTFIAYKNKIGTLVYFLEEKSVGIKHIVNIHDLMVTKKLSHCIVIYPDTITFSAKKYIHSKKNITIEFFNEDELLINKTKHQLSPKYEPCQLEELKLYVNISSGDDLKKLLPKILFNDHIAKYYGLKRGDILKITRSSETSGEYITFRVCE